MSKTICIDAGHYGKYNQSPANKKYYESDMNWKLHLLQKKYLEQYGFQVILTRENQDTDKSLYDRGTTSKGCALFISDHSNAVGNGVNESVDYPVVYVPLNCKGDALGQKLADCIAKTMETKQSGRISKRKSSSGGEYYGVIRGAVAVGTVGMIIEHSFHTNTKSTNWLLNDDNLNKLAAAEAAIIAEHFGMQKVSASEKIYYRVQVGAYTEEGNADKQAAKLQLDGFDTLIVNKGDFYKVQVGAYTKKENAENMTKKLKAKGYSAFVTT